MSKPLRIVLFVLVAMLLAAAGVLLWYKGTAGLRFVRGLGAGFNLGNSLDVDGLAARGKTYTVEQYETAWGNPAIDETQLAAIRTAGFDTVRIPVSWGEHLGADGTVDPVFFARVETVVRAALGEGFYVILDTHHEDWLVPDEAHEAETTARLCALWEQIAARFTDVGDSLLFEGMNEPRLVGTDEEWGSGTDESRAVVNRLNAAFVRTVRAAGGGNAERYLLVCAYGSSWREEALAALELPDDPRLIVSVHAYIPYGFALDTKGTASWDTADTDDTREAQTLFQTLHKLFLKKRIPVMITETACMDKDNEDCRLAWTQDLCGRAATAGVPVVWWDEGGKCRLLDRASGEWVWPDLVSVLTGKDLHAAGS